MKAFADLYSRLDATTSSNAKLAALRDYFLLASPADAAWAVYFLAGGRPRQLVPTKLLRELTLTVASLPEWLFEESYHSVGDLAETMALLLPESAHTSEEGLATWIENKLLPLRGLAPDVLTLQLTPLLQQLDQRSKLVCIKLITGSFRVGVSKLLVTRALSAVAEIDAKRIAQRLVGYTDLSARPTAEHYLRLIAPLNEEGDERSEGQPYPFFLAHPLQLPTDEFETAIGSPQDWLVEWKWDGIRAQLVKRDGQLWVWSRGEELVTDRFPELNVLAEALPDGTVIDGELVVWKHAPAPDVEVDPEKIKDQIADQPAPQRTQGQVQPFALLQQRIGRKTLTAKILENLPVVILAYDLLEWQGEDWREQPQSARRDQLEKVVLTCNRPQLQLSPLVTGNSWQDLDRQREASRSLGVEGFMLKRKDAQYGIGRTKDVGVWWKWKIEPYTADAVLIYAQTGHGRRASLYTDYTFAVWDSAQGNPDRKLVPFAKAYSGLTDAEMREVDAIIRKTTVEKFGPVRSVKPTLVFELGFEGISLSGRHKSGIAVRFPRMLRWRQDKPVAEADTLQTLQALLPQVSRPEPKEEAALP
ncbi:ATP-dependent DNA ligase [Methylophilus sp. Leaf414]|uniref:ATP-dependent DNA ligase n=1 Tax=Methylophilus sp. Leaf414 TaxID=1736371 RepID=UPI0006FF1921|nr:ATP-dependent DNA ligase [Methylophilus sp. Leaf414]KQT36316.1 ATP-dependent DNA ligase [Methylophilus sp. Leaf414]